MTGMVRGWLFVLIVAVAAVSGSVWGDANRSASFEEKDGTNGEFEFGIGGKSTQGGVKKEDVEFLPNVEKIMSKKGWKVGAALQRRWFNEPENQLVGKPANGKGTKKKLSIDDKTVTMAWLLKFDRAKEVHDELVKEATNEAARRELLKQLQGKLGKDTKPGKSIFLGDPSKRGLALHAQHINTRPVGSGWLEKAETLVRDLDDLDAALARFNLHAIPMGKATRTAKGWDVTVNAVGVYVFDSYDFNEKDQPLGWWRMPDDVLKPTVVTPLFQPGYVKVTNEHFQEYRKRHKRGGDFLIISDVRVTDVKNRRFTLK